MWQQYLPIIYNNVTVYNNIIVKSASGDLHNRLSLAEKRDDFDIAKFVPHQLISQGWSEMRN